VIGATVYCLAQAPHLRVNPRTHKRTGDCTRTPLSSCGWLNSRHEEEWNPICDRTSGCCLAASRHAWRTAGPNRRPDDT
jgi:hypothetical protein